ncbi:bifunctional diguanylate cyclase/phosphodiesterase [Nitratifractor sp.]|uniref:putative bifunctional diguanylate cyclase/phosphodiesterase n=1 Tax=Nitratifractor sp. TaxID=2268144 RepID=UPI0025DA94D8|nr:bifunctional diguanylate cyclase/phosphodiesterase [Nitratifractor sp.]
MKLHRLSKQISTIFHSRLTLRIARYILGLSLLIALSISAFVTYRDYNRELRSLNVELSQLEQSVKGSLALHLWQLNFDALRLILDDLLIDRDIVHLRLRDEQGKVLIEKGKEPPAMHAVKRRLPLYYQPRFGAKRSYLGELDYTATTARLRERSQKEAVALVIALFVFFILLSLLMLSIFWGSAVRHLVAIKAYTQKIRLGGYRDEIGELKLDRKRGKGATEDELDELVESINTMQREIVTQYREVEYRSLHDDLTDLPNRRLIKQYLSETIEMCRKDRQYGAFFAVDLDNFRLINESMGHFSGDKLLQEVARRFKALSQQNPIPARISGDEFALLQRNLGPDRESARQEALKLSEKIRTLLATPVNIDGNLFRISACMGIALFGPDAKDDVVIKQADNALHHAKTQGPGHLSFFDPVMQVRIDRRLQLERLIEGAIEKNLFSIYYQPKYDASRKIYSAEALVRLQDESGGIVSPGEFIPLLEQSGAIIDVGDHIIRLVFDFIARNRALLEASGLQSIAINVSPTQYTAEGFAERVSSLAETYAVDPAFITFEVTEEVVASAFEEMIDIMRAMTRKGFHFSIDDFGTGYSSLRYLKNLPISELKIDKSFVDEIPQDLRAGALVKTIIDMAHNFDLDVVAEGVETEEQFQTLLSYRCDRFQGYLFSKPLPEEAFGDLLHRNDND